MPFRRRGSASPGSEPAELARYTQVSFSSASRLIRGYSTSFSLASRLLPARAAPHVANIYALVRLADEVVDGLGAAAGLSRAEIAAELDDLQAQTLRAVQRGYSTNIVVQAFAVTAATKGIDDALINAFFASMRRDIDPQPLLASEVAGYIYGSAEVIGLMCLRTFSSQAPDAALQDGARKLGSAFQKVNFLRDLRADVNELNRNYFPWLDPTHLTDAQVAAVVADIDAELAQAQVQIDRLPADCQAAVQACHDLFADLNRRIAATDAAVLMRSRISVPNTRKAALLGRVLLTSRLRPVAAALGRATALARGRA